CPPPIATASSANWCGARPPANCGCRSMRSIRSKTPPRPPRRACVPGAGARCCCAPEGVPGRVRRGLFARRALFDPGREPERDEIFAFPQQALVAAFRVPAQLQVVPARREAADVEVADEAAQ